MSVRHGEWTFESSLTLKDMVPSSANFNNMDVAHAAKLREVLMEKLPIKLL